MNNKVGICGHRVVVVGQAGSAARQYSDASPCGECKQDMYYSAMYAGHLNGKPQFAAVLNGGRWPIQVSKWYADQNDAIAYAKKLADWNNMRYVGLNYSGQWEE